MMALQPSGHDFDARSEIPYYHYSDEKQELLRISDALENHRVTIAAYFADHEDSKERGNFIRSYFDNTFVEKILSNGQRAGYRAYDDVLTMWRGSYLSREMEVFMRWESVAASVHGMILMDRWLDPEERPLPTEAEQLSLIEEAQAEKETSFTLPQAAIDYVLAGGSGVSQGKFRIYEQFQKGESAEDNVRFLKNEYGIGGHSDAIPGTGIWEDHDGKGITLKEGENSVTLKWSKVEKRIRELIAADRYLNRAEQDAYPNYLHGQEVRSERSRIAKEFEVITEGYSDYARDAGKADVLPARWYLVSCGSAFQIGEKKMYARTAEGDFILPMMREALTAFYTPPVVIRAMYQALENMGFQRGNLLEPSCGVGNFLGMKPESLSDSRIYGIELDSISGRIAQQLYQNSSIAVQGFEKTELPDSFFDVAIGNVPFGDFKLPDKRS